MARFGEFGVYTPSSAPNHGKVKFLRALPHAGDRCSCWTCDGIRIENGLARASINWPSDYPPLFYKSNPPEERFGFAEKDSDEASPDEADSQVSEEAF